MVPFVAIGSVRKIDLRDGKSKLGDFSYLIEITVEVRQPTIVANRLGKFRSKTIFGHGYSCSLLTYVYKSTQQ